MKSELSGSYKFQQVMEHIKKSIIDNDLRKGDYLFPETSYASALKVNRATIRRAMSFLEKEKVISPIIGKKRRVLNDAVKPKHRVIGCLAYGSKDGEKFGNLGHMQVFDHLVYRLQDENMSALKILVDPKKTTVPAIVNSADIDAFITLGNMPVEIVRKLSPVLLIDPNREIRDWACSVQPDARGGVLSAIDYLLETGHRNIGLMAVHKVDYIFFEDVKAGFISGMRIRSNIKAPEKNIITIPRRWTENKILMDFFKKNLGVVKKLDAIILSTSDLANAVLNGLITLGVKVPDDISIIGLGGNYDPGRYIPTLTAFDNDYDYYTDTICKTLKEVLKKDFDARTNLYLNGFNLVERNSVKKRK